MTRTRADRANANAEAERIKSHSWTQISTDDTRAVLALSCVHLCPSVAFPFFVFFRVFRDAAAGTALGSPRSFEA